MIKTHNVESYVLASLFFSQEQMVKKEMKQRKSKRVISCFFLAVLLLAVTLL